MGIEPLEGLSAEEVLSMAGLEGAAGSSPRISKSSMSDSKPLFLTDLAWPTRRCSVQSKRLCDTQRVCRRLQYPRCSGLLW